MKFARSLQHWCRGLRCRVVERRQVWERLPARSMGLLKTLVVLSAKNDFKSEMGGLVDSSVFRRTSVTFKDGALVCATLPLPLSYRLGAHVASDVEYAARLRDEIRELRRDLRDAMS